MPGGYYGKGFNPRVFSFSWGETIVSVPEAAELLDAHDAGDAMAALLQLSDNALAQRLAEHWWSTRKAGRSGRFVPEGV